MEPDQIKAIMNVVEVVGARVVAHMVPTRAFRVIALKGNLVFRVEQLDPTGWKWRTLSTHTGDVEFESYEHALADAVEKQEAFKLKIARARIEQKQATRIAEAAHGAARRDI